MAFVAMQWHQGETINGDIVSRIDSVTHQYKAKKIIYCSLFFIKIIFVITLIQISWVVPLHAKIALQPVKYKGQEIVNKKI
jgi:type IV secretory pathway component VirB8